MEPVRKLNCPSVIAANAMQVVIVVPAVEKILLFAFGSAT